MTDTTEGCPHCGGESYSYKTVQEFCHIGLFSEDTNFDEGEFNRVIRETKPRCDSCGRVVDPTAQRR